MIREVRQLLDEKKYAQLRDLLCSKEPADIAQLFEQFPKEELPLMFRILQKDFATEVFVEMDTELQKALIDAFTDKELFEVFDDLFMDDTVDIIEEMPGQCSKTNSASQYTGKTCGDQSFASVSSRFRRNYNDYGICRLEGGYDL